MPKIDGSFLVIEPWKIGFPICRHCHEAQDNHADGKCLFSSTSWEPTTEEEYKKILNDIFTEHESPPAKHRYGG